MNKKKKQSVGFEAIDHLEHLIQHELNHHLHRKKTKRLRFAALSMILCSVVVLLIVDLIYLQFKSHNQNKVASGLANAMQLSTEGTDQQTVESLYGFKITYNTLDLQATGITPSFDQSKSQSYTKSLSTARSYSDIYLNFLDKLAGSNWSGHLTTSTQAMPFSNAEKIYGNLSDSELAAKMFEPSTITNSYTEIKPSLTSQSTINISGYSYVRSIYQMNNTSFPTASYDVIVYSTVHDNRPYAFEINQNSQLTQANLAELEAMISNIQYIHPNIQVQYSSMPSKLDDMKLTADNSVQSLPSNTFNNPDKIGASALSIIAKNEPAVVRVGSIFCANMNLLLPSGAVGFSVTNACSAVVGSGTIVSTQGYVGTNGHVVVGNPATAFELYLENNINNKNSAPIEQYIQYLATTNVASISKLNSLIQSIKGGDNNALQTLLDLTSSIPYNSYHITSSHSTYAIQLSNLPIKVNTNGTVYSFQYNPYVVPANYVGSNFQSSEAESDDVNLYDYKGTDVGLLQITKSNKYPVVSLGSSSTLMDGSFLEALGYPGFVDGGLLPTKSRTIPTATIGSVTATYKVPGQPYEAFDTSVPIAQGNSGGPAFNSQGKEVAITTYADAGSDSAAGVSKLSNGSTLRGVNDLKSLISSESIKLDTFSNTTSLWHQVVDDFDNQQYSIAVNDAEQVQRLYPNSFLTASFINAAEQEVKEGNDKSKIPVSIDIGLSIGIISILALGFVIIMLRRHHKRGVEMGYYHRPPLNPIAIPVSTGNYMQHPAQMVYPPAPVMPNQASFHSATDSADQDPTKQ